jgi:hypothetical protein
MKRYDTGTIFYHMEKDLRLMALCMKSRIQHITIMRAMTAQIM